MLNNYDFNHTENNNEMENETNAYQTLTPSSSHNDNKKNPENSKKLAKKIGAITLSAVLFGSVAAGSFQAVNYFSPFSKTTSSSGSTTSNNSSSTSLLKTTAVSGSSNTGSLICSGSPGLLQSVRIRRTGTNTDSGNRKSGFRYYYR